MILDIFKSHRYKSKTFIDVVVLNAFLEKFCPDKSLEIGVLYGETLVFIDHHSKHTIGVDIKFPKQLKDNKFKNVKLIHAKDKSKENNIYDFIHVDGDHSYDSCLEDLMYAESRSNTKTIILVDDYYNTDFVGVQNATKQFMEHSKFKVGLTGHNQIFLEHIENKNFVNNLLKNALQNNLKHFCKYDYDTAKYQDYTGQLNKQLKLKMLEHCL